MHYHFALLLNRHLTSVSKTMIGNIVFQSPDLPTCKMKLKLLNPLFTGFH